MGHPTCICAGDPINLATGNEFREDVDFKQGWLSFKRYYNSDINIASSSMGSQWRQSFDRSLQLSNSNTSSTSGPLPPDVAVLYRQDGLQETFTKTNALWVTDSDIPDSLIETDNAQGEAIAYTVFIASSHQFENYNVSGQLQAITDETGVGVNLTYSTTLTDPAVAPTSGLLLTVTDPKGRQLNFTYDSAGHIHQITQPDGGVLTFAYDPTTGNLLSVQYPDGKSLQYNYTMLTLRGSATVSELTGVIDEAGVRYDNITYDGIGRATSSSFAGNVGTTGITYNSNGTSTVQYPLGHSVTMGFTTINGLIRVASLDQPCGPQCNQPWQTRVYDANGYPSAYTDFNSHVTTTTYDSEGLLTQQIEAQGQPTQRTTNTTWDTALRVPLSRTVLDANGNTVADTAWVYNTRGQPLARCEIDPAQAAGYTCAATGSAPAGVRRWTTTYCDAVDGTQCPLVGLRLSATGPRTDLTQTTTYRYYMDSVATGCGTPGGACHQAGDLYQVTDPLGHITTIASYDADGRITRTTDANGVNTDLTYTLRGWLASRSIGGATTTLGYTPYGAVASITDPDNVTTIFTYDAAHRLTDITDAQGNRLRYTLDAAGNKTQEQVLTAAGTVMRSLSRSYNALGQVTAVIDGLNQAVFNAASYDGNGNLVLSADALGVQRQQGFDALNRLQNTIANYNGTDPATSNTQTAFDY
ncbi:MAG: DUF6531 domain-containing protein, partial [Rhodanobacter sp.]